jgi:hypothetical protein
MRVATMFTGATACAVAFTPTAGAQAATIMPASGTVYGNCRGPNQSHWLHVVDFTQIYCLGGVTGSQYNYRPTNGGSQVYSFCGGNNVGVFVNSYAPSLKFFQGTTYSHYANRHGGFPYVASQVAIVSWAGTDKCPLP